MSNTALLIIDAQTGFFEGNPSVYQGETMLQRIQRLQKVAREANVPVIYIRHNEGLEAEWPIHPGLAPQDDEPIIAKMTPNSFHETHLQAILSQQDVTKLVLAGFQTEYCIHTTSRRAHELGYSVTIVEDTHSTFDTDEQTAIDIIADHNAQMSAFAQLVTADAVEFGKRDEA